MKLARMLEVFIVVNSQRNFPVTISTSAPQASMHTQQDTRQVSVSGALKQSKNYLLGGIATSTACIFTNPMDVVKSRMQVQGELHKYNRESMYYKGQMDAVIKIFKNEGYMKGLQKGLAPAMLYQYVHKIRVNIIDFA
jgi:hypothetical protein